MSMAPRREEPIADEPHSWREYRIRVLALIDEHDKELARLHDRSIAMEAISKARSAGWGWIGAVAGSIIGSILTALLLKFI